MKPKDLKFPFTWEARTPRLLSKVLYVPQYYDAHDWWQRPAFSEIFGRGGPVSVEYCSGHGHWILEKARAAPEVLFVAVEKQFERVRKIWSKRENEGVDNLLIVCGEAETFTRHYLHPGEISRIYVNFPDPWPKERHAKHRLINPSFVEELSRVVAAGGEAFLATDDRPYTDQMIASFMSHPGFKSVLEAPFYSHDFENYGNSWFKTLWKEKGRKTHYLHFLRK
ncbi:MAG: tRNA (guanine-N(7)-)-methyltransferase [Chlamydiae bacterium]|nr:tRNA (guanine-N(7)-)-methyltransferase [Chlamydiota bacterium]